jgi:TIR domain
MSSVFLSYSHADLLAVEELELLLRRKGITVWRDQQSLYGGQQWPKAVGEAIASQDFFLLLWSRNAKLSDFVEFEWTTAIALRKRLIPCLLDDTPLPVALRAV